MGMDDPYQAKRLGRRSSAGPFRVSYNPICNHAVSYGAQARFRRRQFATPRPPSGTSRLSEWSGRPSPRTAEDHGDAANDEGSWPRRTGRTLVVVSGLFAWPIRSLTILGSMPKSRETVA